MSKEDCKEPLEKKGFVAFMNWVWNPETKEFLGRTGVSWAKIGIFYLLFYTCLAFFWSCMLYIFMSTITYDKPKWILEDSLIGVNPGLGYRPGPKLERMDSTLINFKPGDNGSYIFWKDELDKFLLSYKKAYKEFSQQCDKFPLRSENCPFIVDLSKNPCGSNYGYDTGSPCVLIKLNRIFDWKPEPFKSLNEITDHIKKENNGQAIPKVLKEEELSSGEGQILIHCEGRSGTSNNDLGELEYWPRQGFPVEYFPYTNQKDYLSPFVIIKFNNPKKGVVLSVECIALDKKITVNTFDREGSVHFELLLDE